MPFKSVEIFLMVLLWRSLDAKIARLDADLRKQREAIKALGSRPGPSLEQAKRRAMNTLKQKRLLENQRGQIQDNMMRIDEARYTTSAMQDQADMVRALKLASKEMKSQIKKTKELDVDHVTDVMEEYQENKEYFDEIQMTMSSYDTPLDIDDEELMAEMDMLGDDIAEEALAGDTPAYLMEIPDAPQDRIGATGAPGKDLGYSDVEQEEERQGVAL